MALEAFFDTLEPKSGSLLPEHIIIV